MSATKETFVLSLAAMALAGVIVLYFAQKSDRIVLRSLLNRNHAFAALAAAVAVWLLLFSSFFTHLSGPLDSLRSYFPWLHRAGGHSPHIHPFGFYFERLAFFHHGNGPVWTEGLILLLALAGIVAAFIRRGLLSSNVPLVRFIALYAIILALIYSAISYKTPWCMLVFFDGMILLAGVGAIALVQWSQRTWLRGIVVAGLTLAAAHLAWLAWQANYIYESDRRNPYAYAQTVPDALDLVEKIKALATADPQQDQMLIQVMAADNDYWPLPWYLRQFKQVGWWDHVVEDPRAQIMIVGAKLAASLPEKPGSAWSTLGLYGLRPGVLFQLYVRADLLRRSQQTH